MGAVLPQPSSTLSKSPPPRRRKHAPRQRNPPPINNRARRAHPNLHHRHNGGSRDFRRFTLRPRPQQRSLHRQHPTNRPQNPHRLRRGAQQRNHLRLLQNHPKLNPINRRPISRRPNQPAKPPRPNPRSHSPRHAVRGTLRNHRPRHNPPKPPRQKPLRQPLHLPTNAAQPPKQQQHQHGIQQPKPNPTADRTAQSADHGRQLRIRGRGCR